MPYSNLRAHSEEISVYQKARYQSVLKPRRERNAVDVRALKLLRGCLDCGYDTNSDALEFDHVRGAKVGNMAQLMVWDAGLIAEIAKCDVVCSNCHSIRTAARRRKASSEI